MQWKITDGSFKGKTIHVATPKPGVGFGMTGHSSTTERRQQVSERAGIDGGDVEDFGRRPRTFQADLIFFGNDYRNDLADFENLMNPESGENVTGILILPDLRDAVYAKYQRHTRTTSTDSCTIVSVSWIEDKSGTAAAVLEQSAQATAATLASQNPAAALPSITDRVSQLSGQLQKATAALTNNTFVNGLNSLESSVVNVRVALNSVLNLPRNTRQQLQLTSQRVGLELKSLGTTLKGIQNFTDELSLSSQKGSPTRSNSSAGALDYAVVGVVSSTASVAPNGTITRTQVSTPPVSSFPSGAAQLAQGAAALAEDTAALEAGSSGSTTEVSDAVLVIQNQIRELVQILQAKTALQVVTNRTTSLPEILFENGILIEAIDYYRGLNPDLSDILNVPAYAVVNL